VFGGRAAAEVVRQSERMGFRGAIWPVHPDRAEIAGHKAYRSVAELPGAPDAVFLGVNRHLSVEIAAVLAAHGAGGAVAYASGFAEAGEEGLALQRRLVAAAGAMPFLGPNCYGFINYLDGALLWPDQHGGERIERGIALVTQSGNIGLNLTMQRRALPIAYLATLGNQAAVGLSAMIEALVDDRRVTAIGLHIEGIDDPAGFRRAAERARRAGVPLVALKVGSSQAGAKLAVSHTASLAGADAVVDAYFRRAGVVRVHSIPVLLETLKLLHLAGPLPGADVASMSCSGGEAALIADAADGKRVRFRALDHEEAARVAATLPALVHVSNPLDYHTFSWANEAALTETFAATMAARFDMTMLILDFPRLDRCSDADWDISVRALLAAKTRTGARAAIVATLPESMPEARAAALAAAGIVPFFGIEEALSAIEAAHEAGAFAARPEPPPSLPATRAQGKSRTLDEWQAKRALAAHALSVPEGRLVTTPVAARAAAEALGFPVVVKAAGEGVVHKTELGAVKIDLRDGAAVEAAAKALLGLGGSLIVERMVTDAVAELILGVDRDEALGLYLVVGSGGVLVELIGDRRILMVPATREEIAEAILSLKAATLLAGFRGGPKGDLKSAVEAALAIQSFAVEYGSRLLELDVNPLMIRPQGQGAIAADALIRLIEEDKDD
jgi:acyl-CoA synthetase (NDP forming)